MLKGHVFPREIIDHFITKDRDFFKFFLTNIDVVETTKSYVL